MKLNYRNKVIIGLFLVSGGLTTLFQNCSNKNFTSQDTLLTQSSSLSANAPQDCSIGGEVVAENDSRIFYLTSSVPHGSTCQYESRVCTNGYFTGSYQYTTCAQAALNSCLFNGVTIPHGASVTAFQTPSVAYGQSCAPQVRTCDNGALSGSSEFATCEVGAPSACIFNGMTVANGASVTAFTQSTVGFGSSCTSVRQTRVCTNGVLSGTATYGSCTVNGPASCLLQGHTVPHGGSVYAYSVQNAPSIFTCSQFRQLRYCYNGVLSGTFPYYSCAN